MAKQLLRLDRPDECLEECQRSTRVVVALALSMHTITSLDSSARLVQSCHGDTNCDTSGQSLDRHCRVLEHCECLAGMVAADTGLEEYELA